MNPELPHDRPIWTEKVIAHAQELDRLARRPREQEPGAESAESAESIPS